MNNYNTSLMQLYAIITRRDTNQKKSRYVETILIMKHILFDLKDCPSELLDNEEHIRMSLYVAAKVSNSELININAHKFKPQGVTGLAMLADSHISIHTWPEKNVAKCDIFTCGDKCLPELAVQYLTEEALKAAETTSQEYERI